MSRAVGTSSPLLGNSDRRSGQETIFTSFPKVLGSWWEIFENGDRGSTQNFAARLVSIVVCLGEPFLEKLPRTRKYKLLENVDILKFQKCQFSKNKSPCGSFIDIGKLFRAYLQKINSFS